MNNVSCSLKSYFLNFFLLSVLAVVSIFSFNIEVQSEIAIIMSCYFGISFLLIFNNLKITKMYTEQKDEIDFLKNQPIIEFQNLMNIVNDVVVVLDAENKVINMNSLFEVVIQGEKEELLGKKIDKVLFNSNNGFSHCGWDAVSSFLEDKSQIRVQDLEVRFLNEKEEKFRFLVSAYRYYDVVNRETRAIVIAKNALDSRLYSQLEEKTDLLVQSSKLVSLGEMTSGLVHEINNPLSVIDMSSRRLKKLVGDDEVDSNKLLKEIDRISTIAERTAKIINGVKRFSGGELQNHKSENKLNDLINDAITLCDFKAEKEEIKFIVDDRSNGCTKFFSFLEVSQVVVNLLNNAIDAMEGQLEKKILISIEDHRVVIHDNGPGIPLDFQDKILEPYFTTKPLGKGTGLGLSISQDLCRNNDINMCLEPSAKGARFILDFRELNDNERRSA